MPQIENIGSFYTLSLDLSMIFYFFLKCTPNEIKQEDVVGSYSRL